MPSLVLRPGMFVRLKKQPADLPDFVLERVCGDMCWVRQQSWGLHVYLRIKVVLIAIPEAKTSRVDGIDSPDLGRKSDEYRKAFCS
jgi:hypothetical protein